MEKLILANQEFNIYTHWHEMPLKNYISYNLLIENRPEPNKLSTKAIRWQEQLFYCITDVPRSLAKEIEIGIIAKSIALFLKLTAVKPVLEEKMAYFEFKGTQYYCPFGRKQADGNYIPMAKMTVEEMCDIMRLLELNEGNKIASMNKIPLILATLFRPLGEEYDEEKAAERAEEFLQLPATIAMGAYFFLITRTTSFKGITELSGSTAVVPVRKKKNMMK